MITEHKSVLCGVFAFNPFDYYSTVYSSHGVEKKNVIHSFNHEE